MWTLLILTSLAGGPTDRVLEDRVATPVACVAEARQDIDHLPLGELVGVVSCAPDLEMRGAVLFAPLPGHKPARAGR